jgi:hypothetical protein
MTQQQVARALFLSLIGSTLLHLQAVAKMITYCMKFVFPKVSPLTFEDLQKQSKREQKTMGYFLNQLRQLLICIPTSTSC